jgi:streptogramin lyase
VTLDAPPSPSNDTTPSFLGTASDPTLVTVEIFPGPLAEGSAVATASATPTGGSWVSSHATPALASGTYTAVARQPSAPASRSRSRSTPRRPW